MTFQKIPERLALLALCLIAIVPFASRVHFVPLPQWFGEINVVWLLLAAGLLLLPSGRLFDAVPRASGWCLALAAAWGLQPQFVHLLFPGMSYVTALGWLALALLASMTASLRGAFGDREFAVWLARAIIVGGLVQSLIGVAQLTGMAPALGLFYDGSHPTSNIFGHIGQRNQYAHYLMWAMVSGVYLFAVRRLGKGWLIVLALWMALMLAWAGSRTILLYLVALSALAGLWHWRSRDDASRRMMLAMWASCGMILAAQFALPLVNHLVSILTHSDVENASGVARLAANGDDMGARRFVEMHKAWMTFKAHPLWGVGWSQYAAESVRLQQLPQFASAGYNSGLFTNAHNLVMQLLAEMGAVITALVLLGFAWVVWPFFSRKAEPEGVLALGCLAVTLTHSMLEYPLWYYYFLAMLAVFMAMAPRGEARVGLLPRLPLLAALAWVGWLSISATPMFWELVNLYVPTGNAAKDKVRSERLIEIVKTKPMFAYHALYTLDDYLPITKDNLKQKLELEDQLTAFRPYPDVMLKRAQLEILAGEQAKAEQTLRTTLASFPTYAGQFIETLGEQDPAWEPLRKISREAYDNLPAKFRTLPE
ncbi:PglL family O-oligosaccharyltransferase [Chromobacterium sp. IIBBL 290-4]|uniref:PglL family O-oligosaccharyltransferase n=1 Tax=Chromobacterium sp. IIBBL 290-4 TaxID=2953890 RepID=UPI0020B6BD77|nr:O-antigen ligase family protein [Chromobacterium sp. IIBBL 290-4]UTH75438.1 Wzy polymerase domain-containing protein [Chromobacterium sp. IIBBL 290-4]